MDFPINTKWLNIYRKKTNKHQTIPGPEIEIVDSVSKNNPKLEDY